jgi:hypothetical protein
MHTFDLPPGSRVKVLKATNHKEHHGPDLIQAISLRMEWWPLENSALNMLAEGLQDALLYDPEDMGQMSAEGIPSIKKHRRCPDLAMPVKVPKREFSGYTLEIEHGIDETSALALYGVKLSKFEAEVAEGGVAVIRWSANSSRQITPALLGELCALEGSEIVITAMTPPDTSDAIDGTGEEFNEDHPLFGQDEDEQSAADAFADAEAAGQNYDASEVAKPRRNKNRPSLTPVE